MSGDGFAALRRLVRILERETEDAARAVRSCLDQREEWPGERLDPVYESAPLVALADVQQRAAAIAEMYEAGLRALACGDP
jgi:hypothetical protein